MSSTDQRSIKARCFAAISPSFTPICSGGTSRSPTIRKKLITAPWVNPSWVPSSAARASAFARASPVTAICCENISVRANLSAGVAPMVIGLLVMVCAATPPGASILAGCAATPTGISARSAASIRQGWRRQSIAISLPVEPAAMG